MNAERQTVLINSFVSQALVDYYFIAGSVETRSRVSRLDIQSPGKGFMLTFLQSHALELIGLAIEVIVLLAILREVRELKRHHAALQAHEQQLMAARPLMSTLYTGDDEIMDLAIDFTEQASLIYALGTLSSLRETERHAGESVTDYETRIASVDGRKRSYIASSFNKIVSGCKYRRVFDFAPQNGDQDEISEALANVNFFLRAFDTPRTRAIDLELYHNAETMKGRGDFHFRVSERQLVLRVGGHGNGYANAAILINDTRVIDEFRRYFDSILVAPTTRHVRYEDLETLRELLQKGDVINAKRFLENGKIEPALSDYPQISLLDKKEGKADSHELASTPDHIAETAVLLAAGRGTRMGKTTEYHQKCMLPIGDKPLLAWAIDALCQVGVKKILVLVGYRAEEIVDYISSRRHNTSVEAIRVSAVSTAAALEAVKERVGEQFWFMHANILVAPASLELIEKRYRAFYETKGRYAAAALATVPTTANLTHAVLRKVRRGEVRIIRATRWNGENVHSVIDKETDTLSLGVGLLNRACLQWDRSNDDGLMVEGLIAETVECPVLSVATSRFMHFETEADYRRWSDDADVIRGLVKPSERTYE